MKKTPLIIIFAFLLSSCASAPHQAYSDSQYTPTCEQTSVHTHSTCSDRYYGNEDSGLADFLGYVVLRVVVEGVVHMMVYHH